VFAGAAFTNAPMSSILPPGSSSQLKRTRGSFLSDIKNAALSRLRTQ
jgi:hypothetical protein